MVYPYNPNQSDEYFQPPQSGHNNVAEYMASGLPYVTQSIAVTGSVVHISFPFVTNFFTVKNNAGGTLAVGFTENGVQGSHYFTLPTSGSFGGDIRVVDLYLSASVANTTYEIVAGLTQIPVRNFFILTGSMTGFSSSIAGGNIRSFGYDGIG